MNVGMMGKRRTPCVEHHGDTDFGAKMLGIGRDAHQRQDFSRAFVGRGKTMRRPTGYGESVGHYEGDTLVVDTIGLNNKTYLDNWRTPHSDKLHVTERWRLIEGGEQLEVLITIDDPETFYQPWQALRRYRRVSRPFEEEVCAENSGTHLSERDYGVPVTDRADF
jgi:hypothetical protein